LNAYTVALVSLMSGSILGRGEGGEREVGAVEGEWDGEEEEGKEKEEEVREVGEGDGECVS
jgi:hypothetical protein